VSKIKLIFQAEGSFALWSYTVGHGRLLLRRTKSSDRPTRVDVLFKDVGWLCMPAQFDGITISEADPGEVGPFLATAGSVRTADRTVFVIRGCDSRGYVLSGAVTWTEDAGEYGDPSSLLE